MKSWLDEGILYKDFATRTSNFGTVSDFAAGVFSYYNGDTDALATANAYFTDPNATIVALPYAVRQEGDVIPFDGYHTSTSTLTGQGTFSITSSCPDVELAVSVLDWRYSEEGSFLFNYGIEGISFEYDANGEPQYTDLIVKNENGSLRHLAGRRLHGRIRLCGEIRQVRQPDDPAAAGGPGDLERPCGISL